jgi:hypothetical protein
MLGLRHDGAVTQARKSILGPRQRKGKTTNPRSLSNQFVAVTVKTTTGHARRYPIRTNASRYCARRAQSTPRANVTFMLFAPAGSQLSTIRLSSAWTGAWQTQPTAHIPSVNPAYCRDSAAPARAGAARRVSVSVPPAACADALAARRLRVPDLTPSTRQEGEVRNTTALLREYQAAGGTNPETHWGKPGTPPAPKNHGPVPGFPPDPHSCLPGTTVLATQTNRGRCKALLATAALLAEERL